MKLSKDTRYKIYTTALESHKEFELGLCSAIDDGVHAIKGLTINVYDEGFSSFPEIERYKPERMYDNNWWFKPSDYQIREEILLRAIENTSPVKQKKK